LKPAVFLDRDGTINEEVNYLDNLSELRLIPGAGEGIRLLNQAGFPVVVITNQSGVARGFFPMAFVETVHQRMSEMLRERGASIDAFYFCPHHPEAGRPPLNKKCQCRKPGTGMIRMASSQLDLDIPASIMVGDSLSDLKTAWNSGMRSILVLTGHGRKTLENLQKEELRRIDCIAPDLLAACRFITGGVEK